MMLGLLHFVRGNVRIEVTSSGMERFLNLCAGRDIAFWDVRRTGPDRIEATVDISGFRAMRPFARRTMSRIKVVDKAGLPFFLHKYARRWGLWVGVALCGVAIWLMTAFIWTIDIQGCETIRPNEILAQLKELGLEPGVKRSKIDPDLIKNEIMLARDDLSFFAVNLLGSRVEVNLRERKGESTIVLDYEPCDVVSDKTGVIEELEVYAGTKKAKVGETIQAGELLAVSAVTSAQGETRYVHARAQARLRTWHSLEMAMPIEVSAPRRTGEQRKRFALVLGNTQFNLYLVETPLYACYDKTIERKQLALSEGFVLPITLVVENWYETEPEAVEISREKCSAVLEERLKEAFRQANPEAEIVSENYSFTVENGVGKGILKLECRETTGQPAPLNRGR